MARLPPAEEESAPPVPGWILSFGDMVTNLMACFVLLQTLSSSQNNTLFMAGMGSYRRAVSQFGLPNWLFGNGSLRDNQYSEQHYPMPEGPEDQPMQRVMDDEDARTKEMFEQIRKDFASRSQDEPQQPLAMRTLRFRFSPGSVGIRPAGEQELADLVRELSPLLLDRQIEVRVLASPDAAAGARERWLLSARRSAAIAERLTSLLGAARSTVRVVPLGGGAPPSTNPGDGLGDGSVTIVLKEQEDSHGD